MLRSPWTTSIIFKGLKDESIRKAKNKTLKRCTCGGEPYYRNATMDDQIGCIECGKTSIGYWDLYEAAVEDWNRIN